MARERINSFIDRRYDEIRASLVPINDRYSVGGSLKVKPTLIRSVGRVVVDSGCVLARDIELGVLCTIDLIVNRGERVSASLNSLFEEENRPMREWLEEREHNEMV